MLLTGGDELRLWDARSGEPLGEPVKQEDFITCAAFSPDGKTFITGGYRAPGEGNLGHVVQCFDTASRKVILSTRRELPGPVQQLAFGPDGKTVLVWYSENAKSLVQIFRSLADGSGGRVIGSPIRLGEGYEGQFAFAGNGSWVLLVNELYQARLWDTRTGQPLGESPQAGLVYWVRAEPGGKTVLIGNNGSDIRRLALAVPETGRALDWPREGGSESLAFRPDGKEIAAAFTQPHGSAIRFWDAVTRKATGEPISIGTDKRSFCYAVFSPAGTTLLTVDAPYPVDERSPATVRLWDATTHQALGGPIPVQWPKVYWQERGYTVAFSPDSKLIVVAHGKAARLYDAATGKPAGKPLEHAEVIRSVAFSPDSKRILAGGDDRVALLWETATSQPIGNAFEHPSAVDFVAFSPDNQTILTNAGQTARLWNTATGQAIGAPIRHGARLAYHPVRAGLPLSFSPDGKTALLQGASGGPARLWDARTAMPHGRYLHPLTYFTDMAFSPDGKSILTVCDRNIQLWDAATSRPIGKPLAPRAIHANENAVIVGGMVALFSPDSQTILAKTSITEATAKQREEAEFFEVPQPLEGDAARLRLWVEVITARELDAGGEIAWLDARSWRERWERLQKGGLQP